jgi:hypothetical protein
MLIQMQKKTIISVRPQILNVYLLRPSLLVQSTLEPWRFNLGAMKARPGAVEAHPRAIVLTLEQWSLTPGSVMLSPEPWGLTLESWSSLLIPGGLPWIH